MNDKQFREIFIKFLKERCAIAGLEYSNSKVDAQRIVRLLVNTEVGDDSAIPPHREIKKSIVVKEDYVILDFNYDALFDNFIGIDYEEEAVAYAINLSKKITSREIEAKLWMDYFIKPLIESNINTKTVYLVTSINNSGWESDIWDDVVIVPETVEKLLGE